MTVTNENGMLRIVLSEAETVHYGIGAVLFDEHSKEAKAALKKLLRLVAVNQKISIDASRFLIEIYPIFDGGCEIFFMPANGKRRPFKAVKKPRRDTLLAIELPDGEAVLEICHRLYRIRVTAENRLFKWKEGYRLIIAADRQILNDIVEYSLKIVDSKVEIAKTSEYGVEICRNAVERIGKTLDGK